MTILVTGASGYIGQHLCRVLVQQGGRVRGYCRSSCPAELKGVEWSIGSILDKSALTKALDGCDKIVHLACLPLRPSQEDPESAFTTNALGTAVVVEAARQANIRKFVYTSTVQVYGGQAALPNRENNLPIPDSPYAASKLAGEVWCQMAASTYGLPTIILRVFNAYGDAVNGQKRMTVENIFVRDIADGKRPQVAGGVENGRDFIHISDVIRGICLALDVSGSQGVINIGTGVQTMLGELANIIANLMGRDDIKPEFVPSNLPATRYQASVKRAGEVLGFSPSVSLREGLSKLIDQTLRTI